MTDRDTASAVPGSPEERAAAVAAEVDLFSGDTPPGWSRMVLAAITAAIRDAAAAERERCAGIAAARKRHCLNGPPPYADAAHCLWIEDAIRAGATSPPPP